jgi:hypothetical protein
MKWVAFFLGVLTLAASCVLEEKSVIPEDGGVEAGVCGLCPPDMPVCNDDFQCVECTAEQDAYCQDETPVCKTDAFDCVQCNASSECDDPDAARCNTETNVCEGCQGESDCIGIDGLSRCEAGTCVECTPGSEGADCNGTSCDPATFACTGTDVGSRETCEECVADSECGENGNASEAHRCVEMFYPVGERFPDVETGFCLKVFAPGECAQPYAIRISDRESLSGDPLESYCGINETLATCPAVRALKDRLNEACRNDDDCPESGLCLNVGGLPDRCTYRCASVVECLENDPDGTPGSTCDSSGAGGSGGSGGYDYCGG